MTMMGRPPHRTLALGIVKVMKRLDDPLALDEIRGAEAGT
jgi:hypothetical protein